jgi:hypothetical protein
MKLLEVLTAATRFHTAVQILEEIKVAPAEFQILIAGAHNLSGGEHLHASIVKQQHRQRLPARPRLRSGGKAFPPGDPWPERGSGSAKHPARPPDSAEIQRLVMGAPHSR